MAAKFIKSASLQSQFLVSKYPEIVLIGRSNVGKSSLINALANEKIAKTSKTPGLTRLVNYYQFERYVLVDLPGYGYAKVSRDDNMVLADIIDTYIHNCPKCKLILQLVDSQVITELDAQMSRYFNKLKIPHFVLISKIDRVNKSHFDNNKIKISKHLSVPVDHLIPFSSHSKINLDKVTGVIKSHLISNPTVEDKKTESHTNSTETKNK